MSVLEPVFTELAFIICIRLVSGWILCPARRTITGRYPFADPKRDKCVHVCHYFSEPLPSAPARLNLRFRRAGERPRFIPFPPPGK